MFLFFSNRLGCLGSLLTVAESGAPPDRQGVEGFVGNLADRAVPAPSAAVIGV